MRVLLTGMSAILICGCLGRGNADLLRARIREQQSQIAETERQMAVAQKELSRTQREVETLRSELAKSGTSTAAPEHTEALARVVKLQIHSLLSGGLSKDDQPGDDAFVAQLAPVDDDGEIVKLPGKVELTLLDPALPESHRQVGQWSFSVEECRRHWTRGFAGTGFQFTMPLSESPQHDSLVLHARLTTTDGRTFDANQIVRVTPSPHVTTSSLNAPLHKVPRPLDDINDPPAPPLKSQPDKLPDWADHDSEETKSSAPQPLRDSTNWTNETIPQLR